MIQKYLLGVSKLTKTQMKQIQVSLKRQQWRESLRMLPSLMFPSKVNKSDLIPLLSKDFNLQPTFIPMTKKTLVRKISEESHLVLRTEQELFQEFVRGLDAIVSKESHAVLSQLKQLYDPLNPDKETMVTHHVGKKERLDNEFWLLRKLGAQLERANFQEIPRGHLVYNFTEHPVYEGVHVVVDIKRYEVMRFWVLGEDVQSLSDDWLGGFIDRLNSWFRKWPTSVPVYKRVVLAVRTKHQNKLVLKAFKDIPKRGLEYYLPEGKVTMSYNDQRLIALAAGVGGLSVAMKLVSTLINYNLQWNYILGSVTALLVLKTWNAYKNKKNNYLVNLSKSLYFKNIANNRALLTLVTDRSGDEVFKSSLLAYMFIRMKNSVNDNHSQSCIEVDQLKTLVESWFDQRFDICVDYNLEHGLSVLQQLGILHATKKGLNTHLSVLPLRESIDQLPSQGVFSDGEESLDIDQIEPECDHEILTRYEKLKQAKEEVIMKGWL